MTSCCAVRQRFSREHRLTRVGFLFAHHLIRNDLVPALVELVLETLVQCLPDADPGRPRTTAVELESLRDFTLAYYGAADHGRPNRVELGHDVSAWSATNYLHDLSHFALCAPESTFSIEILSPYRRKTWSR